MSFDTLTRWPLVRFRPKANFRLGQPPTAGCSYLVKKIPRQISKQKVPHRQTSECTDRRTECCPATQQPPQTQRRRALAACAEVWNAIANPSLVDRPGPRFTPTHVNSDAVSDNP